VAAEDVLHSAEASKWFGTELLIEPLTHQISALTGYSLVLPFMRCSISFAALVAARSASSPKLIFTGLESVI